MQKIKTLARQNTIYIGSGLLAFVAAFVIAILLPNGSLKDALGMPLVGLVYVFWPFAEIAAAWVLLCTAVWACCCLLNYLTSKG